MIFLYVLIKLILNLSWQWRAFSGAQKSKSLPQASGSCFYVMLTTKHGQLEELSSNGHKFKIDKLIFFTTIFFQDSLVLLKNQLKSPYISHPIIPQRRETLSLIEVPKHEAHKISELFISLAQYKCPSQVCDRTEKRYVNSDGDRETDSPQEGVIESQKFYIYLFCLLNYGDPLHLFIQLLFIKTGVK